MPRTIWEQTDPRWINDPRWNNPSYLRACAEEHHFEIQRKAFHLPVRIHAANSDADRILDFRDYQNKSTSRPLSRLDPDDCRAFCWKDCAIYGNGVLGGTAPFTLLNQVYNEWFPHRAEDKDVSDGSFFGKFMQFVPAVERLDQIISFHTTLCEKLKSLEKDIPDRESSYPFPIKPKEKQREGAFQLRGTFLAMFMVLDEGWEDKGVRIVLKDEDSAKKYGCTEDGVKREPCDDGSDLGNVCVFRCPLKRAMHIVVSQDPERAKKRMEYNEMLEETLGSEDENDS